MRLIQNLALVWAFMPKGLSTADRLGDGALDSKRMQT
jgi:hypothetical protein